MQRKNRTLIILLILLICAFVGSLGWFLVDRFVDRSGWQEEDGKRYYYDASGKKVTGYKKIDGKWYCCDPTWDAGAYGFGYFNASSDFMAMTGHQWDYEAYPVSVAEGDGKWGEVLWVPVQ